MTAKTSPNDFAQRARERKAHNLTSHFRGIGITSNQIAAMTQADRDAHTAAAGAKTASDETWAMVLNLVRMLESNDHRDPFEGLS
jgi:hypothetical protein